MLIVLSPAKSLDFDSKPLTKRFTLPRFQDDSEMLVKVMAGQSPEEIAHLMSLSNELAELNWQRFQEWEPDAAAPGARQAILAFKGDTYLGLDVASFSTRDFTAAQRRLRILSGLYGVLRPLDLIQPHRLEMGTRLPTERGKNLYDFWGDRISDALASDLDILRPRALVNLASQEYFRSVRAGRLGARIVTPRFEDLSGGEYRVVSFFAKRARGAMASWLILNRVTTLTGLTAFDGLGYRFDPGRSGRDRPTFVREPAV